MAAFVALVCLCLISSSHALSLNYYDKTCPKAEETISSVVRKAVMADKTVPAALLRMHFHDCFIRGSPKILTTRLKFIPIQTHDLLNYMVRESLRFGPGHKAAYLKSRSLSKLENVWEGCDGSVLLTSAKNNAEKDGPPNLSLHSFYVIDRAKEQVEAQCPGVVSCADILALAARDAVVLAGGPYWAVPKGRKDGRISRASETIQMPAPTFNISQLMQSFSKRGLSGEDLVALSGGHTLGFSHCSSFQNRIHNFDSTHDVDPTMNRFFAESLKKICPAHNQGKTAGTSMDASGTTFDNTYYKLLIQGKSLFSSDQALMSTYDTKKLVYKYATSHQAFRDAFAKSMIKMSSLTGGQEVRLHCGRVR